MKYNYSQEFDLNEIYKKLTAPIQSQTVRACDFFNDNEGLLARFQKNIGTYISEKKLTKTK